MLQKLFTYPFLVRLLNNIFNDNDKIKIISLNKFFNNIKTKFIFNKQLKVKLIDQYKWYYDCLTNIIINDNLKFPKSITHLCYVDEHMAYELKNKIPNSVTNLNLEYYFNQPIDDCIPNSVKYLTFGRCFNQKIKNHIPNSVIYLSFGMRFNKKIENCLPDSIIELRLSLLYSRKTSKFPLNLKYLYCSKEFYELNKDYISSNVQIKFE